MDRIWLIIAVILLTAMTVLPASSEETDEGPARKLINSQGCKACHALEGDGGTVADSFEEIRANFSRAEIRLKLVNRSGKHGNSSIPDFSHLSQEELEALVNFIQPES
ncbi:MAG: c-type cytochrome [Desulfuromonadales bacterium]|nr:c-type cytochrome [Desulfuromonadales bacterium]